jgi:hypothetical protein
VTPSTIVVPGAPCEVTLSRIAIEFTLEAAFIGGARRHPRSTDGRSREGRRTLASLSTNEEEEKALTQRDQETVLTNVTKRSTESDQRHEPSRRYVSSHGRVYDVSNPGFGDLRDPF